MNTKLQDDCEECFKIICRGCQWEPNDKELQNITNGTLTACPLCGWAPA